ncbi:MAG: Ig-like domain-containing protein [Solirubrobacterales bacterium]
MESLEQGPMKCIAGRLLRVVTLALIATALGPAGVAFAEGPTVTIASPLGGSSTRSHTPTFTGTTNDIVDEVTLTIYAGTSAEGVPVQTLTTPPSPEEAWSRGLSEPLPDGTYTAQATQTNLLLGAGASAPVTFTVDTVAPSVTLSGIASPTNDSTPSFGGEAGVAPGDIASVRLHIYAGTIASGTPLETLEVTPLGQAWVAEPMATLPDGTYTVQAEQSDEAGNTGSSSPVTFTVKTKGPAVTLSAPASLLNTATPSFSGSAGVAVGDLGLVTLKIYAGSLPVGAPVQTLEVAPAGAAWQASSQALADGTYTAQAEQSDAALNTSASAAWTFTIDTTPPGITLTSPAENGWSDSHSPSVEGAAGTAEGDLPTITIKLFPGASIGAHAPLETLQVQASGGSWSAAFGGLADGVYTVRAEQSDEAGNTAKSESASFTVDTVAPAVSLASVASLTTDPTPSFSGSGGIAAGDLASVKLKIYAGASVSGELVQTLEVTPNGAEWSAGPVAALEDGIYTVQADQADEAGNVGRSTARTFTVKQMGPKVTLTALPQLIETTTPSFGGSAGVAPGDIASVKLKIYAGTDTSGSPMRTLEVTPTGNAWSVGPVAALEAGAYTAEAEQSDEAGNVRESQPSTFTIAPPVPITTTTTTTSTTVSTTTTTTTTTTTATTTTTTTPTTTTTAATTTTTATGDTPTPTTATAATTSSVPATTGSSTTSSGTAVVSPYAALMQPFPIVRIAGADTGRGARLRLLTVQAPAQARITVWCRGRGCPHKPESRIAAAGKAGVVVVEFKQFERSLQAGAVLVIRVSEPGEIGKYTRFRVRHGKLPERVDTCLDPTGTKPIACPS